MSLVIVALAVALTSYAASPEAIQRKRARRAERLKAGVLEKAAPGKVFRVLDVSEALPNATVDSLTKSMRQMCLVPLEIAHGKKLEGCPIEAAGKLVAQENVGAGVLVVSDPKLPITLAAPDRRWAVLNVASLQADKPSHEVFMRRFAKVYWGAIARAMGAGNSTFAGCVLTPFSNVRELDAVLATAPCPEAYNKILEGAKASGIGMITLATYRTACQQGWAPAPTNDVQKAIWDEVHAMPTAPIKIKPETKKVDR